MSRADNERHFSSQGDRIINGFINEGGLK